MTKHKQIKAIKKIMEEFDSLSAMEMMLDSSPCINAIGSGKNQTIQLAEIFEKDGVIAITYHNDLEIGEEYIMYENLDENVIDEILKNLEDYIGNSSDNDVDANFYED